jgi:hypothetical protein
LDRFGAHIQSLRLEAECKRKLVFGAATRRVNAFLAAQTIEYDPREVLDHHPEGLRRQNSVLGIELIQGNAKMGQRTVKAFLTDEVLKYRQHVGRRNVPQPGGGWVAHVELGGDLGEPAGLNARCGEQLRVAGFGCPDRGLTRSETCPPSAATPAT